MDQARYKSENPDYQNDDEEINMLSDEEMEAIGTFRLQLQVMYRKDFTVCDMDCTRNDITVHYTAPDGQKETVIFCRRTLKWRLD